jgi:hypothetical protein
MIPCIRQETVLPAWIPVYVIQTLVPIVYPIAYTRSAPQTHAIFIYVSIFSPTFQEFNSKGLVRPAQLGSVHPRKFHSRRK